MTVPVKMPQLGETVVEGTIIRWLKKEGDPVATDEPLFEISTDKVDTEVPSPASGVLSKILVEEGRTVAVGTELATLDDGAASDEASIDGAGADEVPDASSEPGPSPSRAGTLAAPTAIRSAVAPPSGGGPRSEILSPIVRRLAQEHEIDLSEISGTGAGGRITKKDVEAFIAAGGSPGAGEVPPSQGPPHPTSAGRAPSLRAVPHEREEVVEVTHIRKAIAEHMHRSLQVSARAWNAVEVDMENVARLRDRAKEAFRERQGFNLTYMPFVSRAVCEALLGFPMVNSELRGEEILVRHYVNLGVAVSYDEGLIVPVVKDADSMNLVGLARAIDDLAKRARSKKLLPDEVHGGTFSITNPGPFGSLVSVPIINQPQTGILAFETVQKRPVVIDDAIAIRRMVYISMSWDHRVIDGALAARFLASVKEHLETSDFGEDLGV